MYAAYGFNRPQLTALLLMGLIAVALGQQLIRGVPQATAAKRGLPARTAESQLSGKAYDCGSGASSGSQWLTFNYQANSGFGQRTSLYGNCPGYCFAISCTCYSSTNQRTLIFSKFTQNGDSKGCECHWRNSASNNGGFMAVGAHCF